MNRDSGALLDGLLHGDELGEEDTSRLEALLATEEGQQEAFEWLRVDAALASFGRVLPSENRGVARARLLAEALLLQKVQRRRARSRRWALGWFTLAGTAVAALALFLGIRSWSTPYTDAVTATGDYQIVGAGSGKRREPRRGDELMVGPGGAILELGGYVRIQMKRGTKLTLQGKPGVSGGEFR